MGDRQARDGFDQDAFEFLSGVVTDDRLLRQAQHPLPNLHLVDHLHFSK